MRINSKLFELPAHIQALALEQYNHESELVARHASLVHFNNEHVNRPDSYRSIDDPKYVEPTLEEINRVVGVLLEHHSKTVISKQLGICRGNTLSRWMDGTNKIPYAAWRMLLINAGMVTAVNRIPESDGSRPWAKYY